MFAFQLTPFWSWFAVGWGIALVTVVAIVFVSAFLAADEIEHDVPPWINGLRPTSGFEGSVFVERSEDGDGYRVSVIDLDGVTLVLDGLDHATAHAVCNAFAAGITYAVDSMARGTSAHARVRRA